MKIKKIISIFLIFLIIFTSLPVQAIDALKYFKYGTPSNTEWDDALHFIIRHWHVVEDKKVKSIEEDNHHFVVVEGYIVPKKESTGYDFYYVDQESGNINALDEGKVSSNPYISSINTNTGTIELPVKNVKAEDGVDLEHFSGISVSAGHGSIDANDENKKITITYHQNVHLAKAHVFYSDEKITVYGSGKDDAVFGTTSQTELQKDTAWVYTYKTSTDDKKAGEVVKGDDGQPVSDENNLPSDIDKNNVEKNKVYSTLEGLHTDKTASAVEGDDRKFNLDLEAWYSGAPLADVGLVLDASGSMGFTSDDLKPINIKNLDLKEEDKQKLVNKELKAENYTGKEGPTNDEWMKKIFLTEDDINLMLNPHNTDNSKLSASDYSYFIYDPRDTVNEYVPLGYWDGSIKGVKDKLIGYYEFNKGGTESNPKERDWLINSVNGASASLVNQLKISEITDNNISFSDANLPEDWSSDKRIKMDGSNGFKIHNVDNGVGILLDAKPTSNNFTISFSLKKDNTEEKASIQKYTDILYIGKQSNSPGDKYYRAIRDGSGQDGAAVGSGSSKNRFRGYNVIDNNTFNDKVTDINSVFSGDANHTITLVFQNGTVTSYMDGNVGESNSDTNVNSGTTVDLSGYDIIINGFNNEYNGAALFIDNVAVFDTALTKDEVSNIESILKSEESKYTICNECFSEEDKEDSIGVVSNYFVGLDGGTPGWYYVNYDSEWEGEYFNQEIQSCKRYWGIPKSGTDENEITFTDEVNVLDDKLENKNNTKLKYKPEKDTPVEFYIDEAGYLRCFFTSSTKQATAHASYVYYKEDSKYVKTEALQRALGSFTTMLDEVSPDSKISAVRFSSDKVTDKDFDKLVLLDWTDDSIEAQDIMSLERGEGGTIKGTESDGDFENAEGKKVTQYNYGLTGGTATYTGLKSFQENLANHDDGSADKYLIIFTDGKDSTEKQEDSKKIADELKNDGYTIFAVMLTGGSVEYSEKPDSEYQEAKQFLLTLVGNLDTQAKSVEEGSEKDAENINSNYFYSTAEENEEESSSIDALTKIFTDEILTKITYNLKNYTVEDYIDSRFDLVSADDSLYKLNANGKITVNKSDGSTSEYDLINGEASESGEIKEDNGKYLTINLTNSSKVEESAHNARLYFNKDKKMYYLKWVDQTIPGCVPDAKKLSVWNGRVTIKAKDDFIGGNAVLTNGNEKEMNWVYSDKDENKSSGTSDSVISTDGTTGGEAKKEDEYPSKGFPRVTVNVPAPTDTFTESNTIYMGENLDQNALSEKLMKSTYEKNKNDIKQYYLEYLSRYANKYKDKKLENLKQEIISGKKVSIPYYYLPNSKNTNLTGTEKNENDQLGTLEYQVVSSVEPNGEYGGIVKDRNVRKLTFTVKYTPLIVDVEETAPRASTTDTNTRKKLNEELVSEDEYKWDEDYKPVVGDNVEEKELMKSESTTNEVSGEIALQLVLKKDVRDVIGNNDLTYTIDLVRNYDGKKETVGKFTATYTKDKLPKEDSALNQVNAQEVSEANEGVENNEVANNEETNTETDKEELYKIDEEGNVTILAKLEYNEEYMNTNGLPIGTYTVENPKMSYKKNLKVKLPNIVTEKEEYVQELFTVGNNNEAPQSYLASFEKNNEIQLGKTGTDKTYTDYRFGLLRVTPFTYYQIPKTGSSSLVILYGFIAIFATVGISMEFKKNKKNQNTKNN